MPYLAFRSPWARPVQVSFPPLSRNPKGFRPQSNARRNPLTRESLAHEGIKVVPSLIALGAAPSTIRLRAREVYTFLSQAYAIPANIDALLASETLGPLILGKVKNAKTAKLKVRSKLANALKAIQQPRKQIEVTRTRESERRSGHDILMELAGESFSFEDEEEEKDHEETQEQTVEEGLRVLNDLLLPWSTQNKDFVLPPKTISFATYKKLIEDRPREDQALQDAFAELARAKGERPPEPPATKVKPAAIPLSDVHQAVNEVTRLLADRYLQQSIWGWRRLPLQTREERIGDVTTLLRDTSSNLSSDDLTAARNRFADNPRIALFKDGKIADRSILNASYINLLAVQRSVHDIVQDAAKLVAQQHRLEAEDQLATKPSASGELVATAEQAIELNMLSPEAISELRSNENRAALLQNYLDQLGQTPLGRLKAQIIRAHVGQGSQTERFNSGRFISRDRENSDYRLSDAFSDLFGVRYKPSRKKGRQIVLDMGVQPKSYHLDLHPGRSIIYNGQKGVILKRSHGNRFALQLDSGITYTNLSEDVIQPDNDCPSCIELARRVASQDWSPGRIRQLIETEFANAMRGKGYSVEEPIAEEIAQPDEEQVQKADHQHALRMLEFGTQLHSIALEGFKKAKSDGESTYYASILSHLGTDYLTPFRRFKESPEAGFPFSYQSTAAFQDWLGVSINTRAMTQMSVKGGMRHLEAYMAARLEKVDIAGRFHFAIGRGSTVRCLRAGYKTEGVVLGQDPLGNFSVLLEQRKILKDLAATELAPAPCPSCVLLGRALNMRPDDVHRRMEDFANRVSQQNNR